MIERGHGHEGQARLAARRSRGRSAGRATGSTTSRRRRRPRGTSRCSTPDTDRDRKRPKGTSGVEATRNSMTAKIASSTTATARVGQRVGRAPRRTCRSPRWRRPGTARPAVTVIAPATSSFWACAGRLASLRNSTAATIAASADGDVDEEHPAPRQLGGEDAPEDGPGGAAGPGHRAPDPERLGQAERPRTWSR